jgi:resuscitation-promoting factor RpfB
LPQLVRLRALAGRPGIALVIAVVLTALLSTGVAWSVTGKTAVLSVDGQPQTVDFRGSTVEDVLEAAGISVGERDLLVPAADAEVGDGDKVALRRARLLTLVVDGVEKEVWVTAASVDEALDQVGLRGGLALSASRSRSLPLDGFRLEVGTPKAFMLVADGAERPVDTTAVTVAEGLQAAGIVLGPEDRVSKGVSERIVGGERIQVVRVRTEEVVETVAVKAPVEQRQDPELFKGETKVIEAGKAGSERRVVRIRYADGAVEARDVVRTEVVTAPVTRVVAVGTKARPKAAAAPSGPRQSTGGADSLNWPALARCESGGNPRAVNPSGKYRGLYQFSMATWRSVGGQGDPIDNSAEEQTYRAKVLYNRSGAGQWPHCGKYLFT